jgi:predicted ester cyclase
LPDGAAVRILGSPRAHDPQEAAVLNDDQLETRLFALWSRPPDGDAEALAAFGAVYADPVLINGAPMALTDLVARARVLHVAFSEHEIEIVDRIAEPGKLAIAFRHKARHTGPWTTPAGEIAPTGRTVAGLGIDLLTLEDDRVAAIWVLADELQRLQQVGALRG